MGTKAKLRFFYTDAKAAQAQKIMQDGLAEFERINQLWSPYIPSSELSIINQLPVGKRLRISKESYDMIQHALAYSRKTQGAFDITIYTLSQHYDYQKRKKPQAQKASAAVQTLGYDGLRLTADADNFYLSKRKEVSIDLGGIAKGYAIDQVIKIFQAANIRDAMVSLGGDSRALGNNRGEGWWVGIKKPRGEGVALRFPISNAAFSTSGDYERYFIDAQTGTHYHHILDPKKGQSASTVTSATVLGPKGLDTDALSTSIFVLGVEKGLSLIGELEGFEAIMIDAYGKVHYSDGLVPAAEITPSPRDAKRD